MNPKIALVTGASSGIGYETALKLLSENYEVYGIGRSYPKDLPEGFHPLVFDLSDTLALPAFIKANVPAEIDLLINCAGVSYYGPHETLSVKSLHEMVSVNVEAPLILTNLLLRGLRERGGTIVMISSVTAKQGNNTFGCAYGATKAAMSHFSDSLFEEVRKSGVRILTLHPDLTDTALYRNADFRPADTPDCVLSPAEVADAVLWATKARCGMVVRDITLRPQRNRIERRK